MLFKFTPITFVFFGLIGTIIACFSTPEQRAQSSTNIAIENVYVWNGNGFPSTTSTVVVSGDIITNANPQGATVIDGNGGYLLPGFIDAHCHIQECSYLTPMRQYGITTALDMGSFPYSALVACRAPGVTDVRGPGGLGTVNGTDATLIPGYPKDGLIPNVTAAEKFVMDRVEQGVDYIKLFLDILGPTDQVIQAVVETAHNANRLVIGHAPTSADYSQAEASGVDIPCHAPLDQPLNATQIASLVSNGRHVVPTLIMMQSIVNNTHQPFSNYVVNAKGSVTEMIEAGVPIVVGTDSNLSPYVPANPPFGISLHHELQLLVQAGLSPVQAIQGATSLAASTFRLYDRGTIAPGLRADLVLLSADPTIDIANSLSIEKVWLAGVEFDPTTS
jgi:imidazolonepropionase-like amidohydrolase